MFIDAYNEKWFDDLCARIDQLPNEHRLYLLIDGAFVPGLHKQIQQDCIAHLFEILPSCTAAAKDVSPFLIPFAEDGKRIRRLLAQCNRWPMISLIQTAEPIAALSRRLSAWCIVEADGQRFNFRFADTRRLPAIYQTLDLRQRAQLTGPAVRWSYVTRHGGWTDLAVDDCEREFDTAQNPLLDGQQFAALVEDSRIDELLSLLQGRGHDVYRQPSRSHGLVSEASRAAVMAELADSELLAWCEWFWRQDQLSNSETVGAALAGWRKTYFEEASDA